MYTSSIPSWFKQENETKDIWGQHPIDSIIDDEINALENGLKSGWKETEVQQYLKSKPYLFDGLF